MLQAEVTYMTAIHDDRSCFCAPPHLQIIRPGEADALDRCGVDRFQRAESLL